MKIRGTTGGFSVAPSGSTVLVSGVGDKVRKYAKYIDNTRPFDSSGRIITSIGGAPIVYDEDRP
jgi:hypothetical protein